MSKIVITLTDTESGHVKIDCTPEIPKLIEIAKSKDITAAEAYAMKALRTLVEDSIKQGQAEGLIPQGAITGARLTH
jgi:hypothetical protein